MVLQIESTKSYSEPNKEQRAGAVPVQSPEEKAQDIHSNRDPYTPEESTASAGQTTHIRHKSGSNKGAHQPTTNNHCFVCPTRKTPRPQAGGPASSQRGGPGSLTSTGRTPDHGEHVSPEKALCRRHTSKHVTTHEASDPRIHDIQAPGKKVVPYSGARTRTPLDVWLESQRPIVATTAPIVAG